MKKLYIIILFLFLTGCFKRSDIVRLPIYSGCPKVELKIIPKNYLKSPNIDKSPDIFVKGCIATIFSYQNAYNQCVNAINIK
jgi:hypothetical protein